MLIEWVKVDVVPLIKDVQFCVIYNRAISFLVLSPIYSIFVLKELSSQSAFSASNCGFANLKTYRSFLKSRGGEGAVKFGIKVETETYIIKNLYVITNANFME